MTLALDRTRRALDQAPPAVIPGQLAVAAAEPEASQPEHDVPPLVHHQPSLWSL